MPTPRSSSTILQCEVNTVPQHVDQKTFTKTKKVQGSLESGTDKLWYLVEGTELQVPDRLIPNITKKFESASPDRILTGSFCNEGQDAAGDINHNLKITAWMGTKRVKILVLPSEQGGKWHEKALAEETIELHVLYVRSMAYAGPKCHDGQEISTKQLGRSVEAGGFDTQCKKGSSSKIQILAA
ncbi:hypothetical protein DL95DRAFT_480286 [Leptodontidium sp. 2 PMI_412]|nr:hypothetical protein DL95DRAFT_480286 [Leptodontidium sp. 2 PMI_412]